MRPLLLVVAALVLAGCGSVPPGGDPAPPAALSQPAETAVQPMDRPSRVDIPAIGVTDELVPVGLAADGKMVVPAVDETGWYEPGVPVGAVGPAVLTSHVDYKGVPGAFQRLGDVQVGDDIVVTDADGRRLTFDVYDKREFPKAEFDAAFVFGDRDAPELVAITCSGGVVNHHYTHNTAVAARLVQP